MPDAVLTRTYALPAGPRVRLRIALLRDAAAVLELLRGRGVGAGEVDARRLLAIDPSHRRAAPARRSTAARPSSGSARSSCGPARSVDTLVVDEARTDGLGELLGEVLHRRAEGHAARVA